MKAIEFQTQLHNSESIEIPLLFQSQFKKEQKLRIIVLIEEDTNTKDEVWSKMATKQFFSGYSDEDSIYDTI